MWRKIILFILLAIVASAIVGPVVLTYGDNIASFFEKWTNNNWFWITTLVIAAIGIIFFVYVRTSKHPSKTSAFIGAVEDVLVTGAFVAAGWGIYEFFPSWLQYFMLGTIIGIIIPVFLVPFYKKELAHDPNDNKKVAALIEVAHNRSVVMTQGGQPREVIRGGQVPSWSFALFGLWWVYKMYVWLITRMYVYLPYIFAPFTYTIPRFVTKGEADRESAETGEDDTELVFKVDRSNHVRTQLTTWYVSYGNVEIQKIPFRIKGSIQIWIRPGKEIDALYKTDSWNILLNQALNAVARSYVREHVTIDDALGEVPKDLWTTPATDSKRLNRRIAKGIQKGIRKFKLNDEGLTLEDIGIATGSVAIIDFQDELTDEQREKVQADFFGRQQGRRLHLEGQGTASAQQALRDVHEGGGQTSADILSAQALEKAATGGSIVDAFLGALTQNQQRRRD